MVNNVFHNLSIGTLKLKNNIVQAPLASYSDRAYRHLASLYGSSVAISEMVSAEGLLREGEKTLALIKRADTEKQGESLSIPFVIQLFGSNENAFKKATEVLLKHIQVPLIDINSACPVKKVMKTGSGASLMKEPKLLGRIVKTIKEVTDFKINVSVKLRIGINNNSLNYLKCAEEVFKNGGDAVSLHTRTAEQLYSGRANHEHVRILKKEFKDKTILASGDIFNRDIAKDVLTLTNADGVLAARGAIGNPFIFTPDIVPTNKDYIDAFKKHVELHEYYNDSPLRELRKFTPYYLKHITVPTKQARMFICTQATTKDDFFNALSSIGYD